MSDIVTRLRNHTKEHPEMSVRKGYSHGWFNQSTSETEEAADTIEQLQARNEKLEAAIRWACGESPPGTPDFPIVDGPPYYRWRTQLRVLSGIAPQPLSELEE